jgi:CHASE2 domain-containing sensor protein
LKTYYFWTERTEIPTMKTPKRFRKKLWIESLVATGLVYFIIWLFFSIISISFEPFNFLSKTIEETQLTDLYFSKLTNNEVDTNVVLVNVGSLDRQGIALLVDRIYSFGPSSIALDVFFSKEADTSGTGLLTDVFIRTGEKLVLPAFYLEQPGKLDPEYIQFPGIVYGHSNLITNEDRTLPVRSFYPSYDAGSAKIYAFAGETVHKANPEAFEKFTRRHHHMEMINYIGDEHAFKSYSFEDIFTMPEGQGRVFRDKIVIIGFLRAQNCDLDDLNDMFFTPVNKHIAGRAHLDMSGAVINANIVSMMLSGNYIRQIPTWLTLAISFLVLYLHMVLFLYFASRTSIWYFPTSKFLQLVSISGILLLVFIIFKHSMIMFPTKYLLTGMFVSTEIVLIYEAAASLAYKLIGYKSILIHQH